MAIFYLLHNLIPFGSKYGITNGQRNCRVFLIGVFIYVLIYIYLKNMEINGHIHEEWYESIKVGLYVLIIADISVMAFIYKDYYGRSIINEVNETVTQKHYSDKLYEYDYEKHVFCPKSNQSKSIDDIFIKKDDKHEKLLETKSKNKSENKSETKSKNKSETKSKNKSENRSETKSKNIEK